MAVSLVQVNGQFTDDNGTIQPGQVGSETGSGVVIGNGYVLTAGHIVFEFNRQTLAPSISSSGLSFYDYRGYQAAYLNAAQQSLNTTTGVYPANTTIEGRLYTLDSVVIQQSGVGVSKSSAGLVAFVSKNDLLSTSNVLPGSNAVYRDGLISGHVSGRITSIDNGDLSFNKPAQQGDSGGSYGINYAGKAFIIGTQSSNRVSTNTALGTVFTGDDITAITDTITSMETGNLSTTEPTNLFVGSVSADTITGSVRPDIILGRDGDDTLDGGDVASATRWGNDQLFGGNGEDTLIAGKGDNLYHGGVQNLRAASDLTIDGTDTVDYSQLTATDPEHGIKIQIGTKAVNNTWRANKDFSHATFVTDLGRDKGVDTLISIEKVTGTSADDIVEIKQLSSMTLANTNHVGGIDAIDLGAEDKSSNYQGDYVDLSGLNETATVNANGKDLTISASEDSTRNVRIANAEHILGTKQNAKTGATGNDLFRLDGKTATIDFGPGGGHDLVETGDLNGEYNLKLDNLNPADVTIIAGGQDLYYSDVYDYNPFNFYEFIGFRVNSTGDTIIFVNKDKMVGVGHAFDGQKGMAGGLATTPISSVQFANGVTWDASRLWSAVGNGDHGQGGDGSISVIYPEYTTNAFYDTRADFIANVNANYFQADPIAPLPAGASPEARPATQASANFQQRAPKLDTSLGEPGGEQPSGQALVLSSYHAPRQSSLAGSIAPLSGCVGHHWQANSLALARESSVTDAASAARLNKLIENMAAFQGNDSAGPFETLMMDQRNLEAQMPTLAVAH